MVSPITPTALATPNPLAAEVERPAVFQNPAQQVTATEETLGTRTATDAQEQVWPQDKTQDGNSPLDKALQEVNSSMQAWATGMRFSVDPDAQRIVISIVDNATGKVLRTVPSDAIIRMAKMIVQLQGQGISTKA